MDLSGAQKVMHLSFSSKQWICSFIAQLNMVKISYTFNNISKHHAGTCVSLPLPHLSALFFTILLNLSY